jgi:predicted nuclease of restriction endonuclease-like (RecB) superfamily
VGHIVLLPDAVSSPEEREWYARQAIQNGWSRNARPPDRRRLVQSARRRSRTRSHLPAEQSERATAHRKTHNFDFLSLSATKERAIERGMIQQVQSLILELGRASAFVGSQYPLEVGGRTITPDLLFYHYRLRCFVVFELKVEAFKPSSPAR